ncbi:related to ornithine aminotransferase [Hanseniaspora guilliermondii]|uniref:Related to ornithine aminotransferase n=1 Tax=Hanseniaspora guilliermondii TaxID=56406 RepID=A0A1L0CSI4_9ASCO|nr:related to ornithine aminotransferase [Hanseniaspora guilliermondii]
MTISPKADDSQSYVFQSVVDQKPPQVLKGEGIKIVVKKNGKIYEDIIDAVTGAAVGALGWGDKDIPQFMVDVLPTHTYTYPAIIGNENSEKLAKFYIDHSPKGAFASALWCCSGSESNENAIKIIKQYWKERGQPKKNKFISRDSSYHGYSIATLSISENARADEFSDILLDTKLTPKMPVCYPYRHQKDGQSEEEYVQELIDAAEKVILENDPETICSITVETLPGSSLGTVPPPKGYLPGLRRLCDKYDILFHLDEVMCGTGRSNPNGGLNCWENFLEPGQFPDIQTVGKTLGSGYITIAGVLIGPKIKAAYDAGSGMVIGGHTYASHGFNCGVSLKIQEKIMRLGLTKNIFNMGNLMGQKLKETYLGKHNIIGDVRGIGGFWTCEIVKNKDTKQWFDKKLDIAHRAQDCLFEAGLNVVAMQGCVSNKTGEGDFVFMAPSFIITTGDVDEILKRFTAGISALEKELIKEGEWK